MKFFLPVLCFVLATANISCNQIDLFELHTSIPDSEWKSDNNCKGTFSINDTNSMYNIYVIIRHTDAYAYNNIWLNLGSQAPGDTMNFQKINCVLGNDQQGWEGVGMNDIWEVRKKINEMPCKFKKIGAYSYQINHIMREDPLKNILSVGIRIQKIEN